MYSYFAFYGLLVIFFCMDGAINTHTCTGGHLWPPLWWAREVTTVFRAVCFCCPNCCLDCCHFRNCKGLFFNYFSIFFRGDNKKQQKQDIMAAFSAKTSRLSAAEGARRSALGDSNRCSLRELVVNVPCGHRSRCAPRGFTPFGR